MIKFLNKKINTGITLISLVITIVVLIILATVIINLSLGNNGIFNRARTAKEQYQNAEDFELKAINDIDSIGYGRESYEDRIARLEQKITEYETRITALEASGTNNVIIDSGTKTKSVSTSDWQTIEEITLSDYGHGKAVISYDFTNQNTPNIQATGARILINGVEKNFNRSTSSTNSGCAWLSSSCSTVISYDNNTKITFGGFYTVGSGVTATSVTARYRYQILLIPEVD